MRGLARAAWQTAALRLHSTAGALQQPSTSAFVPATLRSVGRLASGDAAGSGPIVGSATAVDVSTAATHMRQHGTGLGRRVLRQSASSSQFGHAAAAFSGAPACSMPSCEGLRGQAASASTRTHGQAATSVLLATSWHGKPSMTAAAGTWGAAGEASGAAAAPPASASRCALSAVTLHAAWRLYLLETPCMALQRAIHSADMRALQCPGNTAWALLHRGFATRAQQLTKGQAPPAGVGHSVTMRIAISSPNQIAEPYR